MYVMFYFTLWFKQFLDWLTLTKTVLNKGDSIILYKQGHCDRRKECLNSPLYPESPPQYGTWHILGLQ